MKRYISIFFLCLISSVIYAQEYTQFRIDEKQKRELLKNGDSFVTMIESYLNSNEKSLSNDKYPSLSDPTNYIEKLKKESTNKLYKNICIDCYIAEYKDQLRRLDNHGLTKNANDVAIIMQYFFDQDKDILKKYFDLVLSEAKNEFSFESMKFTQGRYVFTYFDESTRGTNNPRYIYFQATKKNTGNIDLEIGGKDLYTFSMVDSKFLDFAGFWVKYINKNIDLETLSVKGDKAVYKLNGATKTVQLIKGNNNSWTLRNY